MLRAIPRCRTPLRSLFRSLLSCSPPPSASSSSVCGTPCVLRNPVRPLPSVSLFSSPFSTSSRRKRGRGEGQKEEEDEEGVGRLFVFNRDPSRPPRLFVVQPRLRPDAVLSSKLDEALNLANSLEEPRDGFYLEDFEAKKLPPHVVVQNPAARSVRAHADTYFGPGTVENVKTHLKALESEEEIDAVFVNAILSGIQQRNLEVAFGKPVLDRVGLIIEIFNAHAETKEAKLQSELAALMYRKTRLVRVRGPGGRLTFGPSGEAEVVSARGRGSGGRGFISGAGETELQLQRRRILERRNKLLSQIEEVRRTRAVQRSARRRHGNSNGQGLATVAIVGYTNAGKSTLVSALSESDLFSDNRLFATVDPRLRSVILPSGRKALLSDTVGFISDLPVQLVDAFHATLEEVVEADLLVHVLDSSAPNLDEQRSSVLQVLRQIGVSEEKIQNMIEVWNKIDLLEENSGADGYLDHDESLGEGEYEEDENFSEVEDDKESQLSCSEPIDEEDAGSGLSQEESLEEVDNTAAELSSGEPVDEDDMPSDWSAEEGLENYSHLQAGSLVELEIKGPTTPCENCVKTSAVVGIGLQELLYHIDEKLNLQQRVEQRSFGPYDRKWRPSYAEEKVAVQ